jgi:hypothetical protein
MAKLIKQIHDLVGLAIDKGITQYISDSQIDDAIDQAQMGLFRPLIKEYAKTKIIRNELLPFQLRSSVTIASKIGSLPSDFEHEIDAWVTVSSVDYEVRILEAGMFRRRLRDPIDVPSTTNLIANIYYNSGKKIELSNDITPLVLNYFKRPAKPVYATTLSGGQYVYADGSSTDVEWSSLVHDILVERSLGILGVSIRDGQVQRAGQHPEPLEASTR